MTINMNGNTDDTNYRYTMDEINVTIGGKGNGIYTIFNNIDKVCESMNHPSVVVMGYIAAITGSNYIASRNTITGIHKTEELTTIILEYIKHIVMCPKCNIPETIPKVQGTKKNATIIICCSACRNESTLISANKRIVKGIDIILKYLKAGNNWTTSTGTMVRQLDRQLNSSDNLDDKSNIEPNKYEINPFDSF